ncbi:hypothetical protein A5893_03765 [Pedobacter psychrophilus]|uniref:Uncharacterized protein n=1 Tax=Pedobacter psychrophilus TaxID=1826909 RepID=A0A179DMF0_9SPHI|nr:hypothetical protein [Pedobacter psychrophilus]OAQ42241.1 hypothetical protein A5893_03765 [Pedobacter psychrophilus]
MENNQTTPQGSLIIDLTSQQFYKEIIKWLNVIFWIGFTICVILALGYIENLIFKVETIEYLGIKSEISKSKYPPLGLAVLIYSILIQLNAYKKSLKIALLSSNEDDLINSNYYLKKLFKTIAFVMICILVFGLILYVILPSIYP